MSALGWFDELRRHGSVGVAEAWGLERSDSPAAFAPCPACQGYNRHTKRVDRRLAVNLTPGGGGWYCLQCERKGDAYKLVGWLALGREPTHSEADLTAVRSACAAHGLVERRPGDPPLVAPRASLPGPRPERRRQHLPAAEVAAFWAACRPIAADPQGMGYLLGRYGPLGYRAANLAALHDVVRATPLTDFPSWWPAQWSEAYRIIVPAYNGHGELRAVQARDTRDPNRHKAGFEAHAAPPPKTRWPLLGGSYTVSGLVFADRNGAALLAGRPPRDLARVLVVEGLTDAVRATLYARRSLTGMAVLGLESGAASAFTQVGRRWPHLSGGGALPCVVLPDPDEQGARYLAQVRDALPASVPVFEARW